MDWIQIHLALNHVPVIGMPMLVLLMAVGWWRRSNDITRVALWLMVILTVAAIAIKFSGDFAFEQSPQHFSDAKTFVTAHEEAGDQATTAVFVLGIAAAVVLFLSRREKRVPVWGFSLVLVLGIVTVLLHARCAHSGGKISHPELRTSVSTL